MEGNKRRDKTKQQATAESVELMKMPIIDSNGYVIDDFSIDAMLTTDSSEMDDILCDDLMMVPADGDDEVEHWDEDQCTVTYYIYYLII